jgi:hypothetical protein
MILSSVLVIFLVAMKPEPFLLQSMIDSAKIIGLPRLKTMDHFFARAICIDEVQGRMGFIAYSRKDFLKNYIKINSFRKG